MKQHQPMRFVIIMLALFLIFSGCAVTVGEGVGKTVIMTSEAFKHFKGDFENTPYFRKHKPVSLAVLPFQFPKKEIFFIDTAPENPANIVRRGMYNHLASLPFKDLEIYNTEKRLFNAGLSDIRDIETLIAENPQKLKSILGVDAVVTGEVTHFDRIFAGIYSQIAVGVEVKLWDLKSGELLWRAKHVSRAHAGGLSLSPIGLAMATIAALWNLRQTEMLSQTDELFREIASTIELPQSALAVQAAAPKIDLFAALNTEKPFVLGKKVAFRVIGDPGAKVYVDLGEYQYGIPLTPVSGDLKTALQAEVIAAIKNNYQDTGHEITPELMDAVRQQLASREIYEGTYTVGPDEQQYGLFAKSYLVNSAGDQSSAIDTANTIDIDSRPPQAVSGLVAESLDQKITLQWAPLSEDDLAVYEIWTSTTPLSGYQLQGKSENNEKALTDIVNFSTLFVRVRAVDRATNPGEFSPPLETIALPEPGLYDLPQPGPVLGGEIIEHVFLTAEKSPYTVFADVMVTPGGALYLEPGVVLLFAPDTALTVMGGEMRAYGQKDKPILFQPKGGDNTPGLWQGVVLQDAQQSLLHHVHIQGANVGLTINNSAPTIRSAFISASSQAGLILQDNAKPDIACSVFKANEGLGALVIEGEGLAPVIRNNVFEDNTPFQVQNYAPFEIDLKENYWGSPDPDPDLFLGEILWDPALPEAPVQCP